MICHEFKGGSGTASRRLPADQGGWTVGAIVQANHGKRESLLVGGYPVGRHLGHLPSPFTPQLPHPGMGSIVVALATDAPLLPHQCARLAQRASIGIARTGGGTEDRAAIFSSPSLPATTACRPPTTPTKAPSPRRCAW
ncbi:P1 family peptidase [Serratia ureilytica]